MTCVKRFIHRKQIVPRTEGIHRSVTGVRRQYPGRNQCWDMSISQSAKRQPVQRMVIHSRNV